MRHDCCTAVELEVEQGATLQSEGRESVARATAEVELSLLRAS